MTINVAQIHRKGQIWLGKFLNNQKIQISREPFLLFNAVLESVTSARALSELIELQLSDEILDVEKLQIENAFTFPVSHQHNDATWIGGTGLTHSNRALIRKVMEEIPENKLSDSQKIYQLGIKEGKLKAGISTARPEWFFKGHLCNARTHGQTLDVPWYDLGGGEEAELVAVYYITPNSELYRIGFCLGNEFSDHILEKENHFYITQCKLRPFSLGAEIIIGDIPEKIQLDVVIFRQNEKLWQAQVNTGESNMVYSYENIENFIFQNQHICLADTIYYQF